MKHLKLSLIVAVAFLLTTSVFAQFKIVQEQKNYRDIFFVFSDQEEMQDDDNRAEFVLNIPQARLNKMAQANGMAPETEIVTIYVDAATGNFRTDTESADGKESAFFYRKTKEMCNVTWTTSEFFCMSMAKMGGYQKQAQDMMKNMPNIEKMLQNIPDPAAREKAMKAYKDSQKGGAPAYLGQAAGMDNLKITKTRNTRTVDGDVQTQVKFTKGNESGIAWISKKHMDLAKVAQSINEDMKKTFGKMAGDDIRGQIKDGFPVEIRTFEQNMMRGQASLQIEIVTKIEKGFSGNPFDFDRSKLTEKDPMSMGRSKTRKY